MKAYPVKFRPIAQERIWGGHSLKEWFGVNGTEPVGEYWVLSGHPSATSVAVNGPLAGKSLIELTQELPDAYLGDSPQDRFPLLIKFIEAADDLSVQVHPHDDFARQHENDYGKTEAWYILDHKPEAKVIHGHRFPDRREFLRAVQEKRIRDYLTYREIAKDQLVFVPAQTVHALMAGTTLIEIQQTSDVTYRVYDWDRVDDSGKPRPLHVEKAADVLLYGDAPCRITANEERYVIRQAEQVTHEHLLTCPYFTIEKLTLNGGSDTLQSGRSGNPDVLIVADGEGVLLTEDHEVPLRRGDTVLVPGTAASYRIGANRPLTLLRTYY